METFEKAPTPWETIQTTVTSLNTTLERCLDEMADDVLPEFYIIVTRDEDSEVTDTRNVYDDTFNMVRAGHALLIDATTKRDKDSVLATVENARSILKQIVNVQVYGDEEYGSREAISEHVMPLEVLYNQIVAATERINDEPEFKLP